jgi:hypothetical protein
MGIHFSVVLRQYADYLVGKLPDAIACQAVAVRARESALWANLVKEIGKK